jgi:nitrate/nitrite transporter NarK
VKRALHILLLILAGEMVFSLPFHTARFFRPTLLEAFDLSNTQLGDAFAAYGVMAMLAYFPGGLLADRFPARRLMALSLLATAVGGFYMASFPGPLQLTLLYGYWGVSTILLFWAALIRATREWGGDLSQGLAFGVLDGGRGLIAAGFALLAVTALALYLPAGGLGAADIERRAGLRAIILLYSAATAACGLLVWSLLPEAAPLRQDRRDRMRDVLLLLRRPAIWGLAAVIICAYCAFKGLDNYSLYAVQALGMSEVEAARTVAWASYLRPLAAVLAGVVADRLGAGRVIAASFAVLVPAYGWLAVADPAQTWLLSILASLGISFFAAFALRGVYFALLEESRIPRQLSGTAAGTVSLIGFTPDAFFAPLTGRILDQAPGLAGHQHYFLLLAAIAAAGLGVTAWLSLRRPAGVGGSAGTAG